MQTWLSKRYVFSIDFLPNVMADEMAKMSQKSADLTEWSLSLV